MFSFELLAVAGRGETEFYVAAREAFAFMPLC